MRIAVGDGKHKPGSVTVYLDDENINRICWQADDEEGWADCYERDENDHIKKIFVNGVEKQKIVRRYGRIRIEIR
jgi:hypothetical protein